MKDYKHDLVWKLIDQEISESEMAELEVIFEQEPDLRCYYQECLETEVSLADYASTQPLATASSRSRYLHLSILALSAGAAAILAIGTWIGSFFASTPEQIVVSPTKVKLSDGAHFFPDRPGKTGDRAYHVANITSLAAEGDGVHTFLPYSLTSGALEIDRGELELTFPSGTTVTLNGPAAFELISTQSGWLHRGELSLVKKGTRSFEIFHNQGKMIDIGTSFAMKIDGNDQLNLYVSDGIVDVYDKDNLELRRMVEGEILSQRHQKVKLTKTTDPPDWVGIPNAGGNQSGRGESRGLIIQTAAWLYGEPGTGKASGSINGVRIRLESSPHANGGGLYDIDWVQCIPGLSEADRWYHAESTAIGCAPGASGNALISLDRELVDPVLLFGWGEGTLPVDLSDLDVSASRFFPAHESITLKEGGIIDFGNLPDRQNRPNQAAAIQLNGPFGPDKPIAFRLTNEAARAESVAFTLGVESED